MAHINDHYLKLAAGYLFPEIGRRVNAFAAANPTTLRLLRIFRIGRVLRLWQASPPAHTLA